jgi:hypothetical protein
VSGPGIRGLELIFIDGTPRCIGHECGASSSVIPVPVASWQPAAGTKSFVVNPGFSCNPLGSVVWQTDCSLTDGNQQQPEVDLAGLVYREWKRPGGQTCPLRPEEMAVRALSVP